MENQPMWNPFATLKTPMLVIALLAFPLTASAGGSTGVTTIREVRSEPDETIVVAATHINPDGCAVGGGSYAILRSSPQHDQIERYSQVARQSGYIVTVVVHSCSPSGRPLIAAIYMRNPS
jgi:hypothetical protein